MFSERLPVIFSLFRPCEADANGLEDPDGELDMEEFDAPVWCVPIKANVLDFEWDELARSCQFDVILMDPPWQLASHAPTRGVGPFDLGL